MAGPDRCIVRVLVATVLAGAVPTGSLLAQEKKVPAKSQSKTPARADPKKNAVVLDLIGVLQADRLRVEFKGRLKAQQPELQRVRAVLVEWKNGLRLAGLGVPIRPENINPMSLPSMWRCRAWTG